MKKIAIPVFDDRVSNRLDCCENVLLISIENGVIKNRQTLHWALEKPIEKINSLHHLGVDVLICNGITEFYLHQLENTHIQVLPWINGPVEDLIAQYLEGRLTPQSHVVREGDDKT